MRPNLFRFATSELSQDAILCWILSWANSKHKSASAPLHAVGVDLLKIIFGGAGRPLPEGPLSVEVRRQAGYIDILCVINGQTAVIVEDKAGTKQHSGQLARYQAYVETELKIPRECIIAVYVQTGGQSDYREVKKQGYQILARSDLLVVFEGASGVAARKVSDTLEDFSSYLRTIEDDVRSFLCLPLSQWTSRSWIGFYSHLQDTLGDGEWDYVPNAAGGFWGFWWHFLTSADCQVYLQIEQGKFCFKIIMEDADRRRDLRVKWHGLIAETSSTHGLPVTRPSRFGNGVYMTVAVLSQEFRATRADGLIDLEATAKQLVRAQRILDDCVAQVRRG